MKAKLQISQIVDRRADGYESIRKVCNFENIFQYTRLPPIKG